MKGRKQKDGTNDQESFEARRGGRRIECFAYANGV
jgi:hypothetical protein